MKGFRFVSMTDKGSDGLNDVIFFRKGASRFDKAEFKLMWRVEKLNKVNPLILDVICKSKLFAKRIHPDVFIETIKNDLLVERNIVCNTDYSVEVLE